MGADAAFLRSDRGFGGADPCATSCTQAKGIEAVGLTPGLVLCGNESADGATRHVAAPLGGWPGLPHIASIEMLELDRGTVRVRKKVEGGSIDCEVGLRACGAGTVQAGPGKAHCGVRPGYVSKGCYPSKTLRSREGFACCGGRGGSFLWAGA